ncbi:lactonase family protein [Leifsonia poae]|uniref:6-phosphogluconolactonase n=1 Tax=Leifsonia poae TaxID=110933 RepID=A0A9W6LZS1_9MICO|nr:lactonase family protein [Leifsonia poae]GLJ75962.1 hypothetical protein GCM10017584_15360 [Leifsonia poae]
MDRELLIGTYTETLPHVDGGAEGILSARFDGERVTQVALAAELRNPSWVTASSDGRRVYAVIETAPDGGVAAFSRGADGVLTPLGTASAGGAEPAHLTLDPSERFLVAGTYGGGSISVFALADDGALGERVTFVQHDGYGPDPDRQASPHVHQLSFDPVTGELAAVDLGLGEVRFFVFGDEGELTLRPEATIIVGAAGPRHLAFHPDGRHALLVNELDNTVDVLRRESARGGIDGAGGQGDRASGGDRFAIAMGASTRAADATGDSSAAAVRVSNDGRTVFVTNRGDDTIGVFAFDSGSAAVELVAAVPARVRAPRDLVVSPDGARILVAGQNSRDVAVFAFDEDGRTLDFVSRTPVPTPVCLHFV